MPRRALADHDCGRTHAETAKMEKSCSRKSSTHTAPAMSAGHTRPVMSPVLHRAQPVCERPNWSGMLPYHIV